MKFCPFWGSSENQNGQLRSSTVAVCITVNRVRNGSTSIKTKCAYFKLSIRKEMNGGFGNDFYVCNKITVLEHPLLYRTSHFISRSWPRLYLPATKNLCLWLRRRHVDARVPPPFFSFQRSVTACQLLCTSLSKSSRSSEPERIVTNMRSPPYSQCILCCKLPTAARGKQCGRRTVTIQRKKTVFETTFSRYKQKRWQFQALAHDAITS